MPYSVCFVLLKRTANAELAMKTDSATTKISIAAEIGGFSSGDGVAVALETALWTRLGWRWVGVWVGVGKGQTVELGDGAAVREIDKNRLEKAYVQAPLTLHGRET
jgi:hypothetical protein